MTNDDLSVSVIVPAHNAGEDLDDCVRAILDSSCHPLEILIADDRSTDGAPARVAEQNGVRVIDVPSGVQGPGQARNAAARKASGSVLVFVDADVVVHPDAIERLRNAIVCDESIVAAFGSYDDAPKANHVPSIYMNLRHYTVHQRHGGTIETFWSGLGAVRAHAFRAVGGFHERFARPSIEDVDLGVRLASAGGSILLVPEAQGKHLKRWPLLRLWRTDIFARAVPWGRTTAENPALGSALNGALREKLTVLSLGVAFAAIASMFVFSFVGGAAVAVGMSILWAFLQRDLIHAVVRRGGLRALPGALALHVAYYCYAPSAYIAGLLGARWSLRQRAWSWYACAVVMGLLSAGLLGGVVLVGLLMFADPQSLFDQALEWEASHREAVRNSFVPRFSIDSIEQAQQRLGVLLFPASAAIVAMVWLAPQAVLRHVVAAGRVLREAIFIPPVLRMPVCLLTVTMALLAAWHLDVAMRTDEAGSFLNYGLTNPLVIFGKYDRPNNHVLHSLAMWSSVKVFGAEAWAIRLPAFLAMIASVPVLVAATTRLLTPGIGLLAGAFLVAMPHSIELATNARGYPFVVLAMLLLIAFLPALLEARRGVGLATVVVGSVGLFAIPIMVYPLGIVYAGLFITARGEGAKQLRVRLVLLAVATILVVAALYLPSWAVSPDAGPGTALFKQVAPRGQHGWLDRWPAFESHITMAAQQWVWPLPAALAWLFFGAAVLGLSAMWKSGPAARALAMGLVVGPIAVFCITGFAPPVYWSLAWVPILACIPIAGIALLFRAHERTILRWRFAAIAAIPLSILLASTNDYRSAFANRVTIYGAGELAEVLLKRNRQDETWLATGVVNSVLNYELYLRCGRWRLVNVPQSPLTAYREAIVLISPVEAGRRPFERLPAQIQSRLTLDEQLQFGEVQMEVHSFVASEP